MNIYKYLKSCTDVYHTTFDPKSPGVCRIHLIPPKKLKPQYPWIAIINGYSLIPIQASWAVLLKIFMENLNKTDGKALTEIDINNLMTATLKEAKKVFPGALKKDMKKDLDDMISTFKDLAVGKEPSSEIGYMTLADYAKYMKAPHRMDLMVSAMEKDNHWNCNQHCLHCYAANEKKSNEKELSLDEWKKVIDILKEAGVPQLTFTGGEATIRKDLVEMVDYARWFVTRLNTNGILLTKDLCKKLYDASLDSVQVTIYSYDESIHNTLVGGQHFKETIDGLKNALDSGLDVSVNTPLCNLNKDYLKTIKYLSSLGVTYFSCSGLIPTGNAKTLELEITKLSKEEITETLQTAYNYAKNNDLEISFTSPGWIDEDILLEMNMVVPSCGACLSNMAIAPNGDVIPCQSWLNGLTLGNILTTPWKKIWNSKECKRVRKTASLEEQRCLLKEEK